MDSTSVRIFGAEPDNGPSRELARYAWATGTIYNPGFQILPVFRLDRISRGGDHSPFVSLGDPGLRFTERLENYKRQHLPTDDFAHVNFGYVANVARLNASVVGTLANAPAPPAALARRDQASGGAKWIHYMEAKSRRGELRGSFPPHDCADPREDLSGRCRDIIPPSRSARRWLGGGSRGRSQRTSLSGERGSAAVSDPHDACRLGGGGRHHPELHSRARDGERLRVNRYLTASRLANIDRRPRARLTLKNASPREPFDGVRVE